MKTGGSALFAAGATAAALVAPTFGARASSGDPYVLTLTGSQQTVVTRIGSVNLRTQNQSVHLAPYIGFLWNPGDPTWGWGGGLFITGYAQLDIAANGNNLLAQQLSGVRA